MILHPIGQRGDQGLQGNNGVAGPKGEVGTGGSQGLKGETGVQGVRGIKGEAAFSTTDCCDLNPCANDSITLCMGFSYSRFECYCPKGYQIDANDTNSSK